MPAIGELAEVSLALSKLPIAPVIPNAAVRRVDGVLGVWLLDGSSLNFAPIKLGAVDLQGRVQVLEGLQGGETIVLYSSKSLTANNRISVVEQLPGAKP